MSTFTSSILFTLCWASGLFPCKHLHSDGFLSDIMSTHHSRRSVFLVQVGKCPLIITAFWKVILKICVYLPIVNIKYYIRKINNSWHEPTILFVYDKLRLIFHLFEPSSNSSIEWGSLVALMLFARTAVTWYIMEQQICIWFSRSMLWYKYLSPFRCNLMQRFFADNKCQRDHFSSLVVDAAGFIIFFASNT